VFEHMLVLFHLDRVDGHGLAAEVGGFVPGRPSGGASGGECECDGDNRRTDARECELAH